MGFLDSIPSHMDYRGQKLSEQLFQGFSVTFGVIGFVVGYIFQQLSYTMYVLGVGCALGCLVTLPPWPLFRRNPIQWQKPQTNEPTMYDKAAPVQNQGKKKPKSNH